MSAFNKIRSKIGPIGTIGILILGVLGCDNSAHKDHKNASPVSDQADLAAAKWDVVSPDGGLKFSLAQAEDGGLRYRVDLDGTLPVLDWSRLGIEISRGRSFDGATPQIADFSASVKVRAARAGQLSQSYEMKTGKRRRNLSDANTLILEIVDLETDQQMILEVRVQNDGYGFQYRFPGREDLYSTVTSEATTFAVGKKGRFWGQPYDFATQWQPAYETPFVNASPIGAPVEALGTGWGFPSLFAIEGGAWLLLHEAGLSASFHGSHLQPDAPGGEYSIAFPLAKSAWGYGKALSASTRPWALPWRIGIVGRNAGEILESNLVFDFATPSKLTDTAWIKPGIASWSWLSDHSSSRNLESLKRFIDLSAEMGWPYSLIDANWNTISPTAMDDLVAYGADKNVGLFFWYNSGGRHNTVPEAPRNIMDKRETRRAEFAKLKRLGVKGVKVDFFHSDKQDMIGLYLDILEDAAAFQIMVNFHGSTIPRGWARTWPNLVTMEAVRGGEVYTFPSEPDYGALAPWHNTILPFTRNVIGSMDYTPVIYADQLIPRLTTNGHETALAVLFESGVQHIGDSAQSLRQIPSDYKSFFRNLPTAWDETRYLAGTPGDHVVLARRAGTQWYVAGINGRPSERAVTLDLSFLTPLPAPATLLHDQPGDEGRSFASSPLTLDEHSTMTVEMQGHGGFVVIAPGVE